MNIRELRRATCRVGKFVKLIQKAGIKSKKEYEAWVNSGDMPQKMAELFDYVQEGKMPAVTELVTVSFHPVHPLILLNYTDTAHYELRGSKNGWTLPFRVCRGVVYTTSGKLIWLPFVKFFGENEFKDTKGLSDDLLVDAFYKEDGHMIGMFLFEGHIICTTRGDFMSKASKLATEMANEHAKKFPLAELLMKSGIVSELIHPATKTVVDYKGARNLTILGSRNMKTLEELTHPELEELAWLSGLPLKEKVDVRSLGDARKLVKTLVNREGLVATVRGTGIMVKIKSPWYKLRFRYRYSFASIMKKICEGELKAYFEKLPEELKKEVSEMVGKIVASINSAQLVQAVSLESGKDEKAALKEAFELMYQLISEEEQTEHFKTACRKLFQKAAEVEIPSSLFVS